MSKTKIAAEFREAATALESARDLSPDARQAARRMMRAFAELRKLTPGDRARELEARVAELEVRGATDLAEARNLAAVMERSKERLERLARHAVGLWGRVGSALSVPDAAALTRQANESVLRRLTPLLGRGARHDAALRRAASGLAGEWFGLLAPLFDQAVVLANLLGRVVARHGPTVVVEPGAAGEGVRLGMAQGKGGAWVLEAESVPVREEEVPPAPC